MIERTEEFRAAYVRVWRRLLGLARGVGGWRGNVDELVERGPLTVNRMEARALAVALQRVEERADPDWLEAMHIHPRLLKQAREGFEEAARGGC